jgi:hypothetical protein
MPKTVTNEYTQYVGLIEDIQPTSIFINKKCFYMDIESRKKIADLNFPIGTKVRAFYDHKGNLRDLVKEQGFVTAKSMMSKSEDPPKTAEKSSSDVHIDKGNEENPHKGAETKNQNSPVTGTTITSSPELHIDQGTQRGNAVVGQAAQKDVHMQKDVGKGIQSAPEKKGDEKRMAEPEKKLPDAAVFTEFTKNKTIAVEFCISKASDIVAKHWEKTPPDDAHQTLKDKVKDITTVSDALLEYLKKKVKET